MDDATNEVLKNARRAIEEAEYLLKKTEKYFSDNNITPEKLFRYLEGFYGTDGIEDFSGLVERTISDARCEADRELKKDRLNKFSSNSKEFISHAFKGKV